MQLNYTTQMDAARRGICLLYTSRSQEERMGFYPIDI